MSIIYKELLIVDKENKTARKINFEPGINIITSKLNSVGKTSLSLMLLYSFGAKVKFSDKWNLENIFTKLTLSNNDKEIVIIRYKDTYSIIYDNQKYFYPGQKYGYSEKLYELLGLTIKIKDKNSDTYSTAIPSLYLLPYFLSQTNTDNDRSIFEDLLMYSKKDLYDSLYYHVGALDNNYSNIILDYTSTKTKLDKLKGEKEQQFIEVKFLENKLEEYKNLKIVDADRDLDSDISCLTKYSEKSQEYYLLMKKKEDIKHKIKLLNRALSDNSQFSAKILNNEDIICPICKSDITDFISSTLTVQIAESDLTAELAELKAELVLIERQLIQSKAKLDALKQAVEKIEEQRADVKASRAIIVWNEELQKAKSRFAETQLKITALEETLNKLNKSLKTYTARKNKADTTYRTSFSNLLDVTNINKSQIDINSLGLYESISLSGSEIPRVAISRFFALLETKEDNSIIMPIIFDFPNLDMTEDNIKRCFALICDKITDTKTYPQSFIFSINCEERITNAGKTITDSNIIDIGELIVDDPEHPILLCKNDYLVNIKEIKEMLQ